MPLMPELNHSTQGSLPRFFTGDFVWYSSKQGTMHRSTSHLAHLYTVPFLWPRKEHRRKCGWVDDFNGQCLLWRLLRHKTFFPPALGLPTSTTRGTSVGPPVAVKIDFCRYLWFLSISFVWIIWVQYATDNLSGQEREFVHRPVLIFQPKVNSRASDKQT